VSGDRDIPTITFGSVADYKSGLNGAPKGAYLYFHMVPGSGALDGHLTLMTQPERLTDQSADWFKMMLKDDAAAKANFVGAMCKYCGHNADYEYGQKGL
jgi:hypothetical protein